MKLQKMKKFKIGSQVVFMMVFFFATICVSAWTGPTETPPGGNTAEPLNTSNQTQVKYGNLYFPKWFDGDDDGYYVDPDSNSWLYRLYSYDIRSKIYYDFDNTNYYADPAGTSKFAGLDTSGYITTITPTADNQVATKAYVDAASGGGGCYSLKCSAHNTGSCAPPSCNVGATDETGAQCWRNGGIWETKSTSWSTTAGSLEVASGGFQPPRYANRQGFGYAYGQITDYYVTCERWCCK